ncbi:hypothetical protein [Thiocystis violacea]|uniref:hypothetical protein n=1 Tax=Thiocystis violacea TaxID=13725 RepID=UPI0019059E85|nr:hypothetical protein [Thiocystis violacea]MBK1718372.1 hypothetical protein [Thiocystis violacea]
MTTKTTTAKTVAPTLLAMLLFGVAPLTLAADYPERAAFGERAAAVGLGVDSLNLLKRQPGPGAEPTAAVLLERFHGRLPGVSTSDRFNREVTEKQTSLISEEGWYLNVNADGTSVRYRNYPYLEKTAHLARPVEERFQPHELESLGRDFIAKHLDGLIKLGKNEDLVPYFSEFEISGGGASADGASMDPELVQASTIVFTRVINGQPVLGGGSKIAVIFANDGEPVGFDYDWPSYVQTRSSQKILPLDQIRRRGVDYSKFNPDDAEVKERGFECGYIDLGARKRDPDAVIQAGCMRQAIQKTIVDPKTHAEDEGSGHILKSSLDFLPAGETVETDRVWELARKPVVDLTKVTRE